MIAKLGVQARNILLLDEIDPIRSITDFFAMPRRSEDPILDEVLVHGIQTACRAAEVNANPSLVVAGLLHEIAHLRSEHFSTHDRMSMDALLETGIYSSMLRHFGPAVAEPIRLQIPAVRFLCSTIPTYRNTLSVSSQWRFFAEGGPMSDVEISCFRKNRYSYAALSLRRWHDTEPDRLLMLPTVDYFIPYMHVCLQSSNATRCGQAVVDSRLIASVR